MGPGMLSLQTAFYKGRADNMDEDVVFIDVVELTDENIEDEISLLMEDLLNWEFLGDWADS